MTLEKHEKFIAFCLLGGSLVGIVGMIYLKPPSSAITDNGAAMAIINSIVGALTLAFGGAAGALFKISSSDKKEIGEATATAMSAGPPLETKVVNTEAQPVQVEETADKEELPPYVS